jgi:multiple sugar transport system substrate-binding protein
MAPASITLKGITWRHRRAVDPLLATLPAFRAAHPGIEVDWASRPLSGFEFDPVDRLAERYDLVVFDHPFVGLVARSRCLLPLDQLLAGQDAAFIGPSLDTYRYDGAIWGVPIDAAAQVAVTRPDLMARLGASPPRTWDEVMALGRQAGGRASRSPLPSPACTR